MRGPFLIPSILWHREWATRPSPGTEVEILAHESDRLILALNLAGYEVLEIVLGVGQDAGSASLSLDLESMVSVEGDGWTPGTPWPAGAGAALALRVVPRTLLEDAVAVFAVDLPTVASNAASATFGPSQAGWLVVDVPGTFATVADTFDQLAPAHRILRQVIAFDLAAVWDLSTPQPPSQPNPTAIGLLWAYDPAHWRTTSRFGWAGWQPLADAAAWVWATADAAPSKEAWLESVLVDDEPTLLERLEEYAEDGGGDVGFLVAQELVELAAAQYGVAFGPLSPGERLLFDDLPDFPYTVALWLLQDLFLVNFLGSVDSFQPALEWPHENLTGFYEQIGGGGNETLQLNQGGRYLEGDWQRHIALPDAGHPMTDEQNRARIFQTFSFSAVSPATAPTQFQLSRSAPGVIGWHVVQDPVTGVFDLQPIQGSVLDQGTLEAVVSGAEPELNVTVGGDTVSFHRVSPRARPSEEAITGVPTVVAQNLRACERYPMHSNEWAELNSLVAGLVNALETYYLITSAPDDVGTGYSARYHGAQDLDAAFVQHLRAAFPNAHPLLEPDAATPMFAEQTAWMRNAAIALLGTAKVDVPNAPPDAWTGLGEPLYVFGNVTPALRAFFAITGLFQVPATPSPAHAYEWQIGGVGLEGDIFLGLGFFYGAVKMRKLVGEPGWARTQRLEMNVKGGSGGISFGGHFFFQSIGWANLEAPTHWSPENFVGLFDVTSAYGHFVGAVGGSWGGSTTRFFGDETYQPIASAEFVDLTMLGGLSVGAEAGYQWGYLWFPGGGPVPEVHQQIQYTPITTGSDAGFVLFEFDEATLTVAARRYVRELCARHRALFESPQSRLEIEGYASTIGDADYNLDLSRRRAAAVYQAIRDCMGSNLRIPWRATEVRGLGEDPALPGGDEQANPTWRKVEIKIDGVLTLELGGGTAP